MFSRLFGLAPPSGVHERAITRRVARRSKHKKTDAIPEDSALSGISSRTDRTDQSLEDANEQRTVAMERRIASLEELVESMQEQLTRVNEQFQELEDAGLTAPKSQEHKIKMLLSRHPPHRRKEFASKDEIMLAARWSQISYYTNANGEGALTPDGWNALLDTGPTQRAAGIVALLQEAGIKETASIARMAESAALFPDIRFLAHEGSGGHFDGQVSIWRSDERRLLIVAWRGTDSIASAKLDAHSGFKVPWTSKEDLAAERGRMVGVAGASADDRRVAALAGGPDESISPLPHHGLITHTMQVGKGFLTQYLGERLSVRVKALVSTQLAGKALGYDILITGHSLGGAVATLNAYELACTHLKTDILMVTFGSPRTVNAEFANVLARLPNLSAYRVANGYDVVPRVPPGYLGFAHVGRPVWLHAGLCGPGYVHAPRRFGGQPWQLMLAPISFTVKTGVADHMMDLYLDRLGELYSWSRYERVLEHQRRALLPHEMRNSERDSSADSRGISRFMRTNRLVSKIGMNSRRDRKSIDNMASLAISNNIEKSGRGSMRRSLGTEPTWRSVESEISLAPSVASSAAAPPASAAFQIKLPAAHALLASGGTASASSFDARASLASSVGMPVGPADETDDAAAGVVAAVCEQVAARVSLAAEAMPSGDTDVLGDLGELSLLDLRSESTLRV